MKKSYALRMLGGTPTHVAKAIGITPSAVSQWPEDLEGDLPDTVRDRVQAALWRKRQAALRAKRTDEMPPDEGDGADAPDTTAEPS